MISILLFHRAQIVSLIRKQHRAPPYKVSITGDQVVTKLRSIVRQDSFFDRRAAFLVGAGADGLQYSAYQHYRPKNPKIRISRN
jgi:hypothetical protein